MTPERLAFWEYIDGEASKEVYDTIPIKLVSEIFEAGWRKAKEEKVWDTMSQKNMILK